MGKSKLRGCFIKSDSWLQIINVFNLQLRLIEEINKTLLEEANSVDKSISVFKV